MKKTLAFVLVLMLAVMVFGCKPATTPSTDPNEEATAGTELWSSGGIAVEDLKVGVILVHNENIGYDFAHIQGVRDAMAALGLKDEQVIFKYDIPEDETCYDTAVDLAEQGCHVIFADSFGHETYMIQASQEYPDIMFCHGTGQTAHKQENANICNYFTKIYESRYVSGVVAGLKLKELMDSGEVTDPHVGYVGAFEYAEVKSGYTSFFLGIRSIVPEAYMDVTFTNSWADPPAESAAADALISRGCVIIGQHADTTGAPSAVQAQLDAGKTVYCVGYNVDMLSAAPTAALTSAQNNWGKLYTALIKLMIDGDPIARDFSVGYTEDGVQISPLGPSCAEGTEAKVAETIAAIKAGDLKVFDCSTWTVGGETLTSYDKSWGFEGTQLIWDGYFHESEIISAPLFDIDIDGITKF